MEGMVYGRPLLSEIPHGEILSLDTSEAEKVPGVIRIYTLNSEILTMKNT